MWNAIRTITRVNKAIVVEGFCFTAMVASLPSLRGGAVQVPEHAPPGVKETRRLPKRDVLLPSDLIEKSLGSFLSTDV